MSVLKCKMMQIPIVNYGAESYSDMVNWFKIEYVFNLIPCYLVIVSFSL